MIYLLFNNFFQYFFQQYCVSDLIKIYSEVCLLFKKMFCASFFHIIFCNYFIIIIKKICENFMCHENVINYCVWCSLLIKIINVLKINNFNIQYNNNGKNGVVKY